MTQGLTLQRKKNISLKLIASIVLIASLFAALLLSKPSTAEAIDCPCSLWSGETPTNAASTDTNSVELGVKFKADTSGYITGVRFYKGPGNGGIHTGTLWKADGTKLATGTFTNETTTGWQQLTFATPVPVTPNATYVASYFAPQGRYAFDQSYFNSARDAGPLHALKDNQQGGNGVYAYSTLSTFPNASYLASNYWVDVVFETTPPSSSAPTLVLTSREQQFSNYYPEILKTEGFTSFHTATLADMTPELLARYDAVVLGSMPLTDQQVTHLSEWVEQGGNLIAMRPDLKLAPLLGLQPAGGVIANKYLKIDTAHAPGAGLVAESMQFHGEADRYSLNGASPVATLYTAATTASEAPAVTMRTVGSNGGQAVAFTYDLAKSVVYTRQGNPAWAGQNRETVDGIVRADDMFFGNASWDPQSDWVDLNKVAIPQADEQQRLLTNTLQHITADKKPLPHFWYLPKGKKAAVVMTADDHATADGGAQVMNRFNRHISQSPAGCNVAQWECVRSSNYFYLNNPMTLAQAQQYTNQGFELGVHLLVNGSPLHNGVPSSQGCGVYDHDTIERYIKEQTTAFATRYPGLPGPSSNRTHCISWSDWASQARAEAHHGIRLDTNYYYWPGSWIQNRPGMMNGGGFLMRFAEANGSMIDTYQAMTQMQDEGPVPQTYPYTINTLLDNALGPQGYYGVFTANMHSDFPPEKPDAIIASAQARGVPVVSARQMLQWTDARQESTLTDITWNNNTLSFKIGAHSNTNGMLRAMLPLQANGAILQSIRSGGRVQSFTTETIKGVEYAFFAATSGQYSAEYYSDTTGPSVTAINPTANESEVAPDSTITATFNEALNAATVNPQSAILTDETGTTVSATVAYVSSQSKITVKPQQRLQFNQRYTVTLKGAPNNPAITDSAGNPLSADFTWAFTTATSSSLWPANTLPGSPAVQDFSAVELGVKFKSDINGYITGVRFYKGPGNTGTHTGSLWSATGQLLAKATFVNETATGWQQVTFAQPVPIVANTTYVASYFAPVGRYAGDNNYFANPRTSLNLHAFQNGAQGGNGVYRYGSSGFPTSTYAATNYWVDVVFRP